MRAHWLRLALALASLALLTAVFGGTGGVAPATIAMVYMLVVLSLAASAPLWTAVVAALAAMLCLNYFFLPPVGTFSISDPKNWVTLGAFVAVSVMASQLSASSRARARDAQRAELSSALLASVGHDVRTPLTAIRTAVSNLESGALTAEDAREQARVARVEVERLGQLFDEVLDMARIDAGGIRPQRRWITPAEVIDAAMAHASSHTAGVRIDVAADDGASVEVDPRLTASALAHLIENAARYAGDDVIRIEGRVDHGGLHLEVRDNGPGLRPSEVDRVFEPLYRGEDVRHRIAGTGMGLAIARGLLTAEQGTLAAANVERGGACFTIHVPGRMRPVTEP